MTWEASRRVFLRGAGLAAVGVGLAPSSLLVRTARAAAGEKVLVKVFLRGGADGLNFCAPYGDPEYYNLRQGIALPRPGSSNGVVNLDGYFGMEQIQAELHFVNYLFENGVNVSKPVPSLNGNWVETIQAAGIPFHIVTFVKGKGMRVPDNGYRYRTDAPIEEYFRNWGRILGQMHALTKNYHPESEVIKRPEWFDLHNSRLALATQLPDRLHRVSGTHTIPFGRIEIFAKRQRFFWFDTWRF